MKTSVFLRSVFSPAALKQKLVLESRLSCNIGNQYLQSCSRRKRFPCEQEFQDCVQGISTYTINLFKVQSPCRLRQDFFGLKKLSSVDGFVFFIGLFFFAGFSCLGFLKVGFGFSDGQWYARNPSSGRWQRPSKLQRDFRRIKRHCF